MTAGGEGRKLLLVVDMLNDFIQPEGALYCGPQADKIVPYVVDLVHRFRQAAHPVVFIMDSHAENDLEFRRFPPHCVRGTAGAENIAALEEAVAGYEAVYRVRKTRYSGFYGTNLEEIISNLAPEEVHVVGVCTNICVLYTVEELANRDYRVVVHRAGVASFDEGAHQWALEQMARVLGAEII